MSEVISTQDRGSFKC